MNKENAGGQSIGCSVTSCRYNREGRQCELHRVEIRPCHDCSCSGKADEESFCGSYVQE